MDNTFDIENKLQLYSIDILSGYGFDYKKGIFILVDKLRESETIRDKVYIRDQIIDIKALAMKYCIGLFDIETKESAPCPHQKIISQRYQNCLSCFRTIGFNPAFDKHPVCQLSQKQQRYNLSEHYVYLAYFSPNTIKIGMAHINRLFERWAEQGARSAVVLKKFNNAYEARAFEKMIGKIFRIPEGVSSVQKQKLIVTKYKSTQAKLILNKWQERIAAEFEIETPRKIIDMQSAYFIRSQPNKIISGEKEQKDFYGKVIGMVGDIIIYENNKTYIARSIIKLIGSSTIIVKQLK